MTADALAVVAPVATAEVSRVAHRRRHEGGAGLVPESSSNPTDDHEDVVRLNGTHPHRFSSAVDPARLIRSSTFDISSSSEIAPRKTVPCSSSVRAPETAPTKVQR